MNPATSVYAANRTQYSVNIEMEHNITEFGIQRFRPIRTYLIFIHSIVI